METRTDMYFEFILKSFQSSFFYRSDTVIRIFSTLLRLSVQVSIWTALFQHRTMVEGIALEDMTTYVILIQFIRVLTQTSIGERISESIADGTVVIDFMRPIVYEFFHFANIFGENLYKFVFNVLPVGIIIGIVWGIQLPYSVWTILIFIASVLLAVIMSYYIDLIFALLAFWIKRTSDIGRITHALFALFSGSVVPLWFYPDTLQYISRLLPFHLIAFQPLNIYLQKISWSEAGAVVVSQMAWVIVLIIVQKVFWYKAEKQITVNGG